MKKCYEKVDLIKMLFGGKPAAKYLASENVMRKINSMPIGTTIRRVRGKAKANNWGVSFGGDRSCYGKTLEEALDNLLDKDQRVMDAMFANMAVMDKPGDADFNE